MYFYAHNTERNLQDVLTDFKLSRRFIADVDTSFGHLHHVEVGLIPTFQTTILPL